MSSKVRVRLAAKWKIFHPIKLLIPGLIPPVQVVDRYYSMPRMLR